MSFLDGGIIYGSSDQTQGRLYIQQKNGADNPGIYGKNVKKLSYFERFVALFTSVTMTMKTDGKEYRYSFNIKKVSKLLDISEYALKEIAKKTQSMQYLVAITKIRHVTKHQPTRDALVHNLIFNPKKTFRLAKKTRNASATTAPPRYFVHPKSTGEVAVYRAKKIGNGSFTNVFEAEDIVTGKKRAVKKAKNKNPWGRREESFSPDDALIGLTNEHTKLNAIHTELKNIRAQTAAIQKKPVSEIVDRFYFTSLCAGDLSPSIPSKLSPFRTIPIQKKLQLSSTLLDALAKFHRIGYSHLDIKPENLLFRENKKTQEIKSLQLSDFGSSLHRDELDKDVSTTWDYNPSDLEKWRANPAEREKWDVYSMSKSIIEILLDKTIKNELTGMNRDHDDALLAELKAHQVPEAIAIVLLSGMHGRDHRPSAQDLSTAFNAALLHINASYPV